MRTITHEAVRSPGVTGDGGGNGFAERQLVHAGDPTEWRRRPPSAPVEP